jgi:branched-chain amino acid transport system ATP-binding protein
MQSDLALSVRGLSKRFTIRSRQTAAGVFAKRSVESDFWALRDVSFSIARGEVLGVIGRNGAGKSTLIRSLHGIEKPARGHVRFDGADITGWPSWRVCEAGIGHVAEGRQVFPNLTVQENLAIAGVAHKGGYWTEARVYELFPKLQERALSKGASLSGGEQQMLSIARAVLTNPKVLMLDEPSEGLAPLIVRDVRDAIVAVNRQGVAIVLVEQKLAIPLEISNRLYVIDHGAVAWSGTTDEFRSDRANIERRMTV